MLVKVLVLIGQFLDDVDFTHFLCFNELIFVLFDSFWS